MKIRILRLHVYLLAELAHTPIHRGCTQSYAWGLQIDVHAGVVGILDKLDC